jgi:hypothetical protein
VLDTWLVRLGLLIAACVASVVLSLVRCAHVAAPADFSTVADAVRAAYQDGDLIVVVPFHQATPRTLLGDLPLVELREPEPEILRLHRRLLLIAVDSIGARNDLVQAVRALGAVSPLVSAGRVRAEIVTVSSPMHALFDLHDRIGEAVVSASYGAEPTPCSLWNGSRWTCPRDGDWNYVGRATHNLVDGPRACVWMHPLTGGREMSVTLPEVAGSRLLVGHGFLLTANGHSPVTVEVRRSGQKLASRDVAARSGWEVDTVELSGEGPVSLVTRTRDNGGAHFCIDAWVVE